MIKLKFAKSKDNAIIPSKRDSDAGYDVYVALAENEYVTIEPHETVMLPTGLHSAFAEEYVMVLHERGSTGTRGIGQRSGVIDSNYRGEWMIPLTNHNANKPILIATTETLEFLSGFLDVYRYDIYPAEKAICQALLLPVPRTHIEPVELHELKAIVSIRGEGKLGSSGK